MAFSRRYLTPQAPQRQSQNFEPHFKNLPEALATKQPPTKLSSRSPTLTEHDCRREMDSVIDEALIGAEKEHVVAAKKRQGEQQKTKPSRKRLEFDFAKQVDERIYL